MTAAALPALAQTAFTDTAAGRPAMRDVSGMIMLDYSTITLSDGGAFDLFGVHYMQRANDWLYYGVGAFAPLAQGDYGGFFGADATLHIQRRIAGNWFANAGISVGAAAGGASVAGIQSLSGDGFYSRAYVGLGYTYRNLSFGVNYARVAIAGSPINDATINFFVQRPFSFSVGSYGDAGSVVSSADFDAPAHENIVSLQFNNFAQINPTGRYTGDIGVASTQFTHFHNPNLYSFFAVDIGVTGLHWYNQAHGGIGTRVALSPNVNLYGQIGLGSSGWVTDTVDTGPGFIIYPKAMLEYLWGNGVGATVSAGYLYAPMGTSRNWTLGLGLNYHLSHSEAQARSAPNGLDYSLRGIRLNVFGRTTSSITYNGRESDGISMIAVQADYALSDHWYIAGQIAAAATAFRGYAGYAEGFVGVGWQSNAYANGRLQAYAQLMYGLNDVGVDAAHEVGALLYPAVGVSYHLNDRLSLYSQLGAAVSLGQYVGSHTNTFENYSIGLGVTYRFSLPTRS
ncbi:hypothetical protein [Pararhodobacter zhoushanensis]|uniref:Porin n=1 Tax=Pararhodobacter zhoushanensis TaxID=2479545 RepID=A0ABT3GZZ7_9RHOB|nr:hypothetical protein [Pararhodobacter zhoushanensis]MCW1933073.1 hypothetical protein [Pararhodobacter zhoushanensis]